MCSPPDQTVPDSPLSLQRVDVPQPEHYRELFRLIGAPWLWFSRLTLDDAHLAAIIQHPKVELYSVVDQTSREVGMLELDLREPHDCELSFVGLVPELSGKGHGRWLLAEAVRLLLARGRRPGARPYLLARPPGGAVGLSPRRIYPVQAVDRALPRPAPARHPAEGGAPQIPLLGTPT